MSDPQNSVTDEEMMKTYFMIQDWLTIVGAGVAALILWSCWFLGVGANNAH